MREITYFCDRCGNKISGDVFKISIDAIDRENDEFFIDQQEFEDVFTRQHFCRTCASFAISCMKPPVKDEKLPDLVPMPGADKLADLKKEIVKNKGGKNGSVQLDDGKIYALKQAGWSLAKIKEELRADVSDQTILNHYNKYAAEIGGTE